MAVTQPESPGYIYRLYNRVSGKIDLFTDSGNWKIKISLLCCLYALITSAPNYLHFSQSGLESSEFRAMFYEQYNALHEQIAHPFLQQNGSAQEHAGKLAFRFMPAILGKIIPSQNLFVQMCGIYILNNIAGFFFFWAVIGIVYRFSENKRFAVLAALNFTVIYAGKSFFFDTFLWNDGLAYCFLILALLRLPDAIRIIFLLAAYFTDERAVFGGILVYATYLLINSMEPAYWKKWRAHMPFLISIVCYVMIRLSMTRLLDMHTPVGQDTGVGFLLFLKIVKPAILALPGLFFPFKVWWFFFPLAFWAVRKSIWIAVVFSGAFAILIFTALSVHDISRSITYSFPAVLLCIYLVWTRRLYNGIKDPGYSLFFILLLNICIPTVFVIRNNLHILPPIDRVIKHIL